MSRRTQPWDYFDDDPDFRPDMGDKEARRLCRQARARYETALDRQQPDLDNAIAHGRAWEQDVHAGRSSDDLTGLGPYVLYLRAWFSQQPETGRQHDLRLASNYLRHDVLRYEQPIVEAKQNWWIPENLWDRVWRVALDVLEKRFPDLVPVHDGLRRARAQYRQLPYPSDMLGERVAERYRQLLDEQDRQIERHERLAYEIEQAAATAWRQERSGMSRLVSPLFRDPPPGLVVRANGREYPCTVVKVNQVTVRVSYRLASGAERTRTVHACYLYEWNRAVLPAVDGYAPVGPNPSP